MYVCNVTRPCVWHDSSRRVTWPIRVWHDSSGNLTGLRHVYVFIYEFCVCLCLCLRVSVCVCVYLCLVHVFVRVCVCVCLWVYVMRFFCMRVCVVQVHRKEGVEVLHLHTGIFQHSYVTWLVCIWDMIGVHMWHDWCAYVTWFSIHMWHDSCICRT